MLHQSSFFLIDVLPPVPQGLEGPWGKILVEIPFRAGQKSIRTQAVLVVQQAGNKKWAGMVRPLTELIPQPCTCDLTPLPEPYYEDQLGRAWVVPPELGPHIHLLPQ